MEKIQWDETLFGLGIKQIDDQHKQLVQLINAIQIYTESDDDNSEYINKILNTLVQYVNQHFRAEEQLLKNIKYPKLHPHKEQHSNFEKQIELFITEYHRHNDSKVVMEKILTFLIKWLTSHILIEDRAYVDFIFEGIDH